MSLTPFISRCRYVHRAGWFRVPVLATQDHDPLNRLGFNVVTYDQNNGFGLVLVRIVEPMPIDLLLLGQLLNID